MPVSDHAALIVPNWTKYFDPIIQSSLGQRFEHVNRTLQIRIRMIYMCITQRGPAMNTDKAIVVIRWQISTIANAAKLYNQPVRT